MKYADKKHSLFRYIILNTLIVNRKKTPIKLAGVGKKW